MQKSINRVVICLSVCVPLLFGALLLLAGTTLTDKSQFISFFPNLNNAGTPCRTGSRLPLKVYMYDLPPRFNIKLMDPGFPDGDPVTAANFPAWRWNYGLWKQHSMEYWMMASILPYDGNNRSIEAVRVLDPDFADVFFVPFFSSFSYSLHSNDKADNTDEKLQTEMVNILRASDYWKRSGGRDHVIPLHHPNAFRHYRPEIKNAIFLVADFGRIMNVSRLAKDVVAPYPHMLESYRGDGREDPYDSREILLFFRGITKRKNEGKIRSQLHKMLNNTKDVIYDEGHASEEGFKASTERMRSSKFCLHPAGDTPSSCRLFDAIASLCIPVIVSDKIELPFESEIDYKEFSVFFSVKEALKPDYIVSELRGLSKEKWMMMWSRLKSVAHHFEFQYPTKKGDGVDMIWRQVRQKVPVVKLAVHRNRRMKIPDWWS